MTATKLHFRGVEQFIIWKLYPAHIRSQDALHLVVSCMQNPSQFRMTCKKRVVHAKPLSIHDDMQNSVVLHRLKRKIKILSVHRKGAQIKESVYWKLKLCFQFELSSYDHRFKSRSHLYVSIKKSGSFLTSEIRHKLSIYFVISYHVATLMSIHRKFVKSSAGNFELTKIGWNIERCTLATLPKQIQSWRQIVNPVQFRDKTL
jgi:hypothetical protein